MARKIYHITHLHNLRGIVNEGSLWSDAERMKKGLASEIVGLSRIKHRRMKELEVRCWPGTKVGEYVPFYFCPRSIMLYILYRGNHPDLTYHGGQGPIVHLEADVERVVDWAARTKARWAFSDRNAGEYIANFFKDLRDFDKINWKAVEATDFRDILVKEGKQAEFLIYGSFPWQLIDRVGVMDGGMRNVVREVLGDSVRPLVSVENAWYY